MKKVLFVATVVRTHIMVFHIPYLKMLKENGYEVHVCAKNDYEDKEECNIPYCDKYYDLPFERFPFALRNLGTYRKLKKVIDNNSYDIIHCHTPVGGVLARLAARKARNNGTKVIYTAHGFHFFKGSPIRNWLFFYPIEYLLSKCTDILITINKEDYECAKKSFKAKKIEYVPGVGIDINTMNKISVEKSIKRKELGLPKDAFVILSVGELNKNKNHETVIKAISRLKNHNIYYVICGKGTLEAHIENLIKQLGLRNNVKLLGYRKDISEIIKISDVFIFPSFREGLSVSLMEAMALKIPIICSKIRGNTDLIEQGVGGYLIEPSDIDGFKNAIMEIKEKDTRYMVDINAKKIQDYALDNVARKMREIYSIKDNNKLQ